MKTFVIALVILSLSACAFGAGDQAFFGIFAETSIHQSPMMAELPPEIDAADLANIPGMENFLSMGKAQRSLTMRLWSPGIAPVGSTAFVNPPAGLKLGKKLDLALYRPVEETSTDTPSEPGGIDPDTVRDFTIKIYWGSSPTVKKGQPKIIRWDGMNADTRSAMRREMRRTGEGASYFYKDDWTTAYWPAGKQTGKVKEGASLSGNYKLTTSYTGNTAIDVPTGMDFLPAIELSSPAPGEDIDLKLPIAFAWKELPGVLGLHAGITGMAGSNTLIIWTSSEVPTDAGAAGKWDYLQMSEVAALVKSGEMMKGDRVSVTVPEGIFASCGVTVFNMVGYGPGVALAEGQPLPRVQTKTTLSIMPLAGTDISGMR